MSKRAARMRGGGVVLESVSKRSLYVIDEQSILGGHLEDCTEVNLMC